MAEILTRGSFVILTPEEELREQLLNIERAGRTCYQSEAGPITMESAAKFAGMVIRRGHESVIEHSNMTVKFVGCSRGFTHELVRHRIAGFSQESTRYVDYARDGKGPDLEKFEITCILPPHQDIEERMDLGDGRQMTPVEMMNEIELFYRALRKSGWTPEDARQVLPTGLEAEIVMSANFREWRHVFEMRTQKPAHWEVRRVMGDLLEEVQKIVPVVFDDFVEAGVDNNGLRYFERRK